MQSLIKTLNAARSEGLTPVRWRLPKFALELIGNYQTMYAPYYHSQKAGEALAKELFGVPIEEVANNVVPMLVCAPDSKYVYFGLKG